jgi:phage tail-like protein
VTGASGNGHPTYSGEGFGTLMVRLAPDRRGTPAVVSQRAYLRGALPAVYQESDFGMRFVGALEAVLDPIVAILDALPAHFDPDHAPQDVLELLAGWLGIELDESQTLRERRELVRQAAELSRWQGTHRGLQLALALAFPSLPLRVEDHGGVTWRPDQRPREDPPASFVVYCDKPIPEDIQAAVARCIEQYKPVHTSYRLRVKAAKKVE